MEIKTSLKQLQTLFGRSAATEELDPAVRRLAARLTVLTAHVMRVEAKVDAEAAAREAFAKELKGVLATFAETLGFKLAMQETYPVAEAPAETDTQAAPPAPGAVDEDPDKKILLEQLQREGEADKQSVLARKPAEVTPLHKPNNTSKPSTPGAA
jgi:hypothetical protein